MDIFKPICFRNKYKNLLEKMQKKKITTTGKVMILIVFSSVIYTMFQQNKVSLSDTVKKWIE